MKVAQVAKSLGSMLIAPLRIRQNPPRPPAEAEHYEIPTLATSLEATSTKAADIAVAHTPEGRWRDWPPRVLAECDEPLMAGAPDLRGVWQVYKGPLKGHVERVEQAGNRTVITAGGVIHDLAVGGPMLRDEGVGDAHIVVDARYENGRHNLYLNGKRRVVTRYRDGDDMVWRWGPYTNRLRRLSGPEDAA